MLEGVLLVAGLLALGIWSASYVVPAFWQDWENWVFDSELRGEKTDFSKYADARVHGMIRDVETALGLRSKSETPPLSVESPGAPHPTTPQDRVEPAPAPNSVIGRLTIPRLNLRTMVREGVEEKTLSLALGHIPGTAQPGQKGSVGIAGHRDRQFRPLRGIQKSDLIEFETPTHQYSYRVASTQIVQPKDVWVLKASRAAGSELTLVTCYPFDYVGSAPYRFIIKAYQTDGADSIDRQNTELAEAKPKQPEVAVKPTAFRAEDKPPTAPRLLQVRAPAGSVGFTIPLNQSRELTDGVSMGVESVDAISGRVTGWMWIMPDRHTIWLKRQLVRDPITFTRAGKHREVMITRVTEREVSGYLLVGSK